MHHRPSPKRTSRAPIKRGAIACLLLVAGCAAPARIGERPGSSRPAGSDSALVVLEVRLRRSAEVADGRGALRVFDQDLRVEYRAGGTGAGLDAGEVAVDGRPMRREVDRQGGVSYRAGRDELEGGAQSGNDPWVTIANTGAPRVPAASVRAKLAPYPLVTQPTPEQGVVRSEELAVVMLPPVPDVWYRVSLTGAGSPVIATDLGAGRWVFPPGTLAGLAAGRARLLIEVETSCGDCPGSGLMRANWSARTELELAVTLL
ncbi:MAG: hypothetical protein ACRENJ_11070 [Candidatus Eiseniibacteriota bacterium]